MPTHHRTVHSDHVRFVYARPYPVGIVDPHLAPGRPVGGRFPPPRRPLENLLLAALPADVQKRLLPRLELVYLAEGETLYESGDELRYLYFPRDSIVSLACATADGETTEISAVGKEGMVGVSVSLSGQTSPNQAIVRSPGSAYRLPRRGFEEEFNRGGAMLRLILAYIQSLVTQTGMMVACNRHHHIEQQVCRWLLVSLDRLPGRRIPATQELIASMLGVRRESVTEAVGRLHRQGVIDHERGWITVLDRPGLEKRSCECYAALKMETERLLPYLHHPHH